LQQASWEWVIPTSRYRNHFNIGQKTNNFTGSFYAIDTGHADIHQNHIRLMFFGEANGFFATTALGNNTQAFYV
jgi:hypothetical protein